VDTLKNNEGSSGIDYSTQIQDLQNEVNYIPSEFNDSTWNSVRSSVEEILLTLIYIPELPNPL
jgi:hypothetical protein